MGFLRDFARIAIDEYARVQAERRAQEQQVQSQQRLQISSQSGRPDGELFDEWVQREIYAAPGQGKVSTALPLPAGPTVDEQAHVRSVQSSRYTPNAVQRISEWSQPQPARSTVRTQAPLLQSKATTLPNTATPLHSRALSAQSRACPAQDKVTPSQSRITPSQTRTAAPPAKAVVSQSKPANVPQTTSAARSTTMTSSSSRQTEQGELVRCQPFKPIPSAEAYRCELVPDLDVCQGCWTECVGSSPFWLYFYRAEYAPGGRANCSLAIRPVKAAWQDTCSSALHADDAQREILLSRFSQRHDALVAQEADRLGEVRRLFEEIIMLEEEIKSMKTEQEYTEKMAYLNIQNGFGMSCAADMTIGTHWIGNKPGTMQQHQGQLGLTEANRMMFAIQQKEMKREKMKERMVEKMLPMVADPADLARTKR